MQLGLFKRLMELSKMEDGWHGGKGRAPGLEVLEHIARNYQNDLPVPVISPKLDGGLVMKWKEGSPVIEIDRDRNVVLSNEGTVKHSFAIGDACGWNEALCCLRAWHTSVVETVSPFG